MEAHLENKITPKVICHSWTALKEACLTQDNLCERSIPIVNRCYMCQQDFKTNRHLFLHCPVATDIWNMFLSVLGFNWVMPESTKDAYSSWSRWKVGKSISKIWKMIPGCIFWVIWTERNRRCFEGLATPNYSLKANCIVLLYSWSNLSPISSPELFLDFVSSLTLA